MNYMSFTMHDAELMEICPNCHHTLKGVDNQSDLIFISDFDKDCITQFQCPYCKESFKRKY